MTCVDPTWGLSRSASDEQPKWVYPRIANPQKDRKMGHLEIRSKNVIYMLETLFDIFSGLAIGYKMFPSRLLSVTHIEAEFESSAALRPWFVWKKRRADPTVSGHVMSCFIGNSCWNMLEVGFPLFFGERIMFGRNLTNLGFLKLESFNTT